jgi:hypothetical protein
VLCVAEGCRRAKRLRRGFGSGPEADVADSRVLDSRGRIAGLGSSLIATG